MFLEFGLWAVLVLAILALFLFLRRKPAGRGGAEARIRRILHNAVQDCSRFELRLQLEGGRRAPLLRCAPSALRPEELVLETRWEEASPRIWAGKRVSCYFKLTRGEEANTYYTFDTSIKDMEIDREGGCRLLLRLPDRLEKRQKRAFVRLAPPKEYLLGAALWAGDSMPRNDLLSSPRLWPGPALLILPARNAGGAEALDKVLFKAEDFLLDNISAGGCRLRLLRRLPVLSSARPEAAILFLELLDPDARKELRYWLYCRLCSLVEQAEGLEARLQFTAWARPGLDRTGKEAADILDWQGIEPEEGAPFLARWVVRRQFEQSAP